MRTAKLMTSLMLAILLSSPAGGQDIKSLKSDSTKSNDRQSACKLNAKISVDLSYLLYLPEDYETGASWPLLLFLHGAGERGSDLNLVCVHGPPKLISQGKSFPFIVVSPQCPKGRYWSGRWHELSALLDDIESRYKVKKNQVYVTGLSMGGFGTWSLLSNEPGRFAAAMPICGGGDPFLTRNFAHIPVWAFHGAKDRVVPVGRTRTMVEALKKHGGNVKLTIYPDAGHDSWTETYNNPEVFEWMLQQKRDDRD